MQIQFLRISLELERYFLITPCLSSYRVPSTSKPFKSINENGLSSRMTISLIRFCIALNLFILLKLGERSNTCLVSLSLEVSSDFILDLFQIYFSNQNSSICFFNYNVGRSVKPILSCYLNWDHDCSTQLSA